MSGCDAAAAQYLSENCAHGELPFTGSSISVALLLAVAFLLVLAGVFLSSRTPGDDDDLPNEQDG